MDKIKEMMINLIKIITQKIENLKNRQSEKMLDSGENVKFDYNDRQIYTHNLNMQIDKELRIRDTDSPIYAFGPYELPFGSFEIDENGNVKITKDIIAKEDGSLFIDGKEIIKNESLKEEVAKQIKQNGESFVITTDKSGNVLKTQPEKYRENMYDHNSRQKTEQVSKKWREKQEEIGKDERQPDEKNEKTQKGEERII